MSASKLLWNLFRLAMAVSLLGLLIAGGMFLFRGQTQAAAAVAGVMGMLFFSINVSNFWQYRWDESEGGAKAVVVAPVLFSGVAVVLAWLASAPVSFAALGVVVVFWFLVTRRRPDLKFSRVPVRLLVDEKGVKLKYANVQLDSVNWEEVTRVAASAEAPGPIKDDLYFFLHNEDGDGCVIPNRYAREVLQRLRRLDGFDNEGIVEAALSGGDQPRLLWQGEPGDASVCARAESG